MIIIEINFNLINYIEINYEEENFIIFINYYLKNFNS